MEPRCRVALIKSRLALVNDLDVKPTLDALLSNLVITPADSQKILAEKSEHDKRRVLLDLIPEKGPKVFPVFLEHLSGTQSWLSDKINGNLATVTQEELDTLQEESQLLSKGGPTAQELQQALRNSIEQYIKNDPSRILEETESTVCVQQSVTVHRIQSEKEPEKMPPSNISELLQTCNSPGQRVFVYGEAGTGKSNLCRSIAQIWAKGHSKCPEQFDYIFPVPMRSIRSHSLIDIICKDAKLIPESCKQRLEQELELKSILFVLDSFEELSYPTPEINKLIRRDLYPRSSVLITARPGQKLEDEENESKPCIRARLEDLTEKQVKLYMASYPGLQEEVQLQTEKKFGMSFLSRPINLWLVCLVLAQISSSAGMPDTQTVLLNMIVQHLMLAYSKKKTRSGLNLKPYKKGGAPAVTWESPMKSYQTEIKIMLEKVGQLCYIGLRNRKRVLTIDDVVLSRADVLDMGLFSEGADDNSVTLPHPLFQEYLAALFLSVDKRARQDLFKELRVESEGSSPRPSLFELLNTRGFENMVRFLVGLSGVPEGLTDLFYMQCVSTGQHDVYERLLLSDHIDFGYEMDLFRECGTDEEKSQIASALLAAPTEPEKPFFLKFSPRLTKDSHLLLHHFDEEQCKAFLRKFYGYQISSHELIQAPGCSSSFLDSFVVGMIYLHNCTVRLKEAWVRDCHVPVSLLTERLAALQELGLDHCTLCDLTESRFLASLNLISSLSQSQTPEILRQPEVSLYSVQLKRVQGLSLLSPPHCTLPATRKLQMSDCDDPDLGLLGQCFTGVGELFLWSNKHVYNVDGQWPSVIKLDVANCDAVNLGLLPQCFTGVSELVLSYNKHVYNYDVQWPSVSKLYMSHYDDINLGSLGQCFTGVSELTLRWNKLVHNDDGQWPSVSKLEVSDSDINLGSLGQCFTGVSELTLRSNRLVYNDGQWSSVSKLDVSFCEDINLGSLGQCFTGVSELTLWSNRHVHNYDGQWSSVRKLAWAPVKIDLLSLREMFAQLQELELTKAEISIEKTDPDRQTQWHTMKSLKLRSSHLSTEEGILDEEQARKFLTELCQQAEITLINYGETEDESEVYDLSFDSPYDSSSDST